MHILNYISSQTGNFFNLDPPILSELRRFDNIINSTNSSEHEMSNNLFSILDRIIPLGSNTPAFNNIYQEYYKKAMWYYYSHWNNSPFLTNDDFLQSANPGHISFDLSSQITTTSNQQLNEYIEAFSTKPFDSESDYIINLPHQSSILRDINHTINTSYQKDISSFLKKPLEHNFSVSGQFKYHLPGSGLGSQVWHVDGDPRFIKMLVYLSTDPTNDGAFRITHWSSMYQDYYNCAFSDISMMITQDTKKRLANDSSLRYRQLSSLAISDTPFGAFNTGTVPGNIKTYNVQKYNAIVFRGSTFMHSGGGNTRNARPVLQLLIGLA